MKLYTAIPEIFKKKWSFISSFTAQICFAQAIDQAIGWSKHFGSDCVINIKDITTPQLSTSSIESFVCDKWRFHMGKEEIYLATITFKDQDQMSLYRLFTHAFFCQKSMFFNDCKSTIIINKDADYQNEIDIPFMKLKDCLINSISSLNISNETEAQIAEFSVEFKCRTPIINFKNAA